MTALWSRAFHTPGTCRCIPCAANTPLAVKRAAANGLAGTWALGTPTSTFVHTTVFAAGLTVDARAKWNRDEQWDSAFETIGEELRLLQSMSTRPTRASATPTPRERDMARSPSALPSDLDWNQVLEAVGMDLDFDDAVFQKRQADANTRAIPEVLWDLLRSDARLDGPPHLDWPASTGPRLGSRFNLPPQSLWAPVRGRLKALRRRASRKKIAIQELSVCSLIHRLLRHFEAHPPSMADLGSLSPHIAGVANLTFHERNKVQREIQANIKALEMTDKKDWPEDEMSIRKGPKMQAEPTYSQDSDGDFHHIASQLNGAITKLFEGYNPKSTSTEDMAVATAKICHNLLISSAAPNLQTFNILLTGFRKWNQPSLLDDVIAEMYSSKIRPNEITCAAILDHYTETQRPMEFSKFVANMRGVGKALMLARADISINEAGSGRLIRVSESKVYQKVYPTPMVFNALMHGILKFAGFERALDIYFEMKEDGWGLDIVGLSRFLDDCLHRADWKGGLIVWEEIGNLQGRVKADLLAKAYAQFLSLCSIAQRPAAFNTVLSDVVKRGYNRSAILTSVRDITNAVRPEKGYLAPAWTADNLLIAVSDYMKDNEAAGTETAPFFQEMSAGLSDDNMQQHKPDGMAQTDPWSAWVEHELGEPVQTTPPNHPNAKTDPDSEVQHSTPQRQRTAAPTDAWTVWVDRELGGKAPDEASPADVSVTRARGRGRGRGR